MAVNLQPRKDMLLTGRGFLYSMIIAVVVAVTGVLQLRLADVKMDSFATILVVILLTSNASMHVGATAWAAYLRRGIVTVIGAWILLWMYVGLSMLFAGIEPEFLRHALTLLPICGVGLTLIPSIAERWATGPSYRSPFADMRPTRMAAMIVAMSVLYSALIMGASYLTTL